MSLAHLPLSSAPARDCQGNWSLCLSSNCKSCPAVLDQGSGAKQQAEGAAPLEAGRAIREGGPSEEKPVRVRAGFQVYQPKRVSRLSAVDQAGTDAQQPDSAKSGAANSGATTEKPSAAKSGTTTEKPSTARSSAASLPPIRDMMKSTGP